MFQSLSRFLLSVSVLAFLFAFSGANAAQPLFLRGDANSDTRVDIGDPVFSLIFIFRGGQAPACMDAVDANDDGQVDISDPVYTLLFLFQGGRSPPPPFPAPGVDPTADNVTCGQTNPSGFGTLLVAIHDTPPASLTSFSVTIDRIVVDPASGSPVTVFPPESDPSAEKIVNLLDLVGFSSIISTIAVPAGDYTGAHVEFDNAAAAAGVDPVAVVPDSGVVNLSFVTPVTVTEGNLTPLLMDFNLTASLTDGGPGTVLLDPSIARDEDENENEIELSEFHGKVVSVDVDQKSFVVDVTTRQRNHNDPVVVGQVTVKVDDKTVFEDIAGLSALAAGNEVEVKGMLQTDGSVLASKVELKQHDEGEDLNDDGVDDANEDDGDRDHDGMGNDDDPDDDNDGIDDEHDNHDDNDDPDHHGGRDDDDNDGVDNNDDNCPEVANPDQADSDGDGIGDACDTA